MNEAGYIFIRETNGQFKGACLMSNASMDNAGVTLANFYMDPNKVRKLIEAKALESIRINPPDPNKQRQIEEELRTGKMRFAIFPWRLKADVPYITKDENIEPYGRGNDGWYIIDMCNILGLSRLGTSDYTPTVKNIENALQRNDARDCNTYIYNMEDGFWYAPYGGQQHRLLPTPEGRDKVLKDYQRSLKEYEKVKIILDVNSISDVRSANLWLKRKSFLTRNYRIKTQRKAGGTVFSIEGDVGSTWKKICELNVGSPKEAVLFIANKLGIPM